MLRNEYSQIVDKVIAVASSERGKTQSKRIGGRSERSQSQLRDMSNVECYYCGKKGDI